VRDAFTSDPDLGAPNVGFGYANLPIAASSIDDATATCTDAIFAGIMAEYCAANASFPVQWGASFSPLAEGPGTVTGCAASGCESHRCPPTRAACVIRTARTALPKLSDGDDGPGYAKVGVQASSLDEAKARCNAEVFGKLSFCPAPGSVRWEVIAADAHGGVHSTCAAAGCSHTCVVPRPE
jgi:hypothetical protein